MSDILNAFTFHGVSFTLEGSNAKADCPFCGKQNHFFVETKTGKYNCRRCSNEGNLYTFLEELWRISGDKPGLKRLETLAADRGIPVDEFQAWGLRVNALDSTAFILPQYNLKGRIANLSKIMKVDGKWKVYGTPTCKLHCFGTNLLQKQQTILWVCEGPWDAMALRRALQTVRFTGTQWVAHKGDQIALKTNGVIAVPGAGTFVTEYLQWFAARDVRLVYDNDHPSQREGSTRRVQPGWDGMQRVLKIARNEDHQATKLQVLVWGKGGFDQELADGYDIRDLLQAPDLTTPQALAYLCSRLAEPKEKSDAKQVATTAEIVPPIACASFDELCKHFKQHLYLSDAFHDTLAVSLATVVSTNHDGEQLFFRVIGPPGSGKTTIAECLSVAREFCFPKSIVTGFHSGFTGGRGGAKQEASLIPEMNGKCVVIKDADTLLNANNKDNILAELRDIYDGSSRSHYRNKKKADFEHLRTTFLLCGTDALRGLNRSFLGERFLDCDILGDADTAKYISTAVSSQIASMQHSLTGASNEARGIHQKILKQVTYGFLLNLHQRIKAGEVKMPNFGSAEVVKRLESMAVLLSFTRAKVERDREELSYRPRAEIATRLVKQFVKLTVCLAIVMGKETVDKQVMSMLAKVTIDTAYGFPFEIAHFLYNRTQGAPVAVIASHLDLAETTVKRNLTDMQELGTVTRRHEKNKSGIGGRDAHYYYLSQEVRELFKLSELPRNLSYLRTG